MSKMRLHSMVLSALAIPCALMASNYYVGTGETRTVNVSGGLSGDNISHRIYIADGGTLKMTNPPSSGAATLYQYVISSNGVCTIDVSDCAGHDIRFAHGIRAKGELRIVGANTVHLGRTRNAGEAHLSIYDIPRVTFVEADGVTEYASGRVIVDQTSTLVTMPTTAGTEWSIADGVEVGLAGEPLFGLSDDYTLGNYDVILMNPAAFKTGATLHVRSGRSLALKPCAINADLSWNAATPGWTVTNNVALGGGGARLSLRSTVTFGLAGNIIGSGDIVEEYSGTPTLDIPLVGNFSFAGRVMTQRANYTLRLVGGSAEGANLQFRAADGSSIYFLPNSGTCTVGGVATNVHVNATSGCVVNADIAPGGATVHAAGGTLNLGLDMMGWTNDVSVNLWLDANVLTSLNALTNSSGGVQSCEGYTVYDKWWDCRQTEPGNRFAYNNRAYMNGSWIAGCNNTYPRRNPTGGPNGLACMYTKKTCESSSSGAGRLYLFDEGLRTCGGDINTATNSARFTIMVYGSEYGGGYSIVGSPSYAFGRAGCSKDNGVFKDKTIPLWIDGERIADPSTTGLSGGWQIVAFENGNRPINSLGWKNNDGGWGGGQQYGEIILLDEAPSDAVRQKIELYLATKWGLLANLNGGTVEPGLSVTAIGSGALAVPSATDLELAGAFDGTLAMNGGALALVGAKAVPSADELPRNGLLAWFDPDLAESVVLETEPTKPNLIGYIFDRDPARRSDTSRLLYINETSAAKPNVGDRCPYWYEGNWDNPFVPPRHWIDNNNYYDGDTLGNAFRLRQAGNRTGADADGMLDVRTVIMAQNSVKGGGTPILGAYLGQTGVSRQTSDWRSALWTSSAPAALTGASVWVNGVQTANVTASPSGFTGKPEVLSIETASDYSLCAFGLFYNSQYETLAQNHGEIFGEIMLWSAVLSEAERTDVEAYLGRKWTGIVPFGYGDFRSLAVSGASAVSASSLALLPAAVTGFDGDMSVSSAVGKFTFVGGVGSHVVNPVSLASAALTLPAAVTLTVDFTKKPEPGVYPLVSAGSITGADTLTLASVGASAGGNRLSLAKENGVIALKVVTGGVTVIIR